MVEQQSAAGCRVVCDDVLGRAGILRPPVSRRVFGRDRAGRAARGTKGQRDLELDARRAIAGGHG